MTEKLQNALNEQIPNLYLSISFYLEREGFFRNGFAGCRNNLQKRSGMHMPNYMMIREQPESG